MQTIDATNPCGLSLDRAVRRGWLEENPARAVELLREEKTDVDPLSLTEVKTLLAQGGLGDEDRSYFTVAFFTGLRPGEEIALLWDTDIDWTGKRIRVDKTASRFGTGPTKTVDSRRDVAMLPIVETTLRKQRQASQLRGPYVFPNREGGVRDVGNMRRVWSRAVRTAKLRGRPMYQTRHTFATLMLGAGENPSWVAQQLGHASAEMVYRRYARFIPNLTRQDGSAASRWLAQEGL
jgi:integrase